MLTNQFKIAWRKLWKNKTESTINIAGLAIGMTAAVLIMLWVQNEWSYDNYHSKTGNIYRVTCTVPISKTDIWVWENSPYLMSEKARQEIPDIEEVAMLKAAVYNQPVINLNGQLLSEKKAAYVSKGWFNVFHYDFVDGSADAFNQQPFSIILSATAAKKYFGRREPVGQVMRLDTVDYKVQAVVKDNPANSSFQFDMLLPVAALQSNASQKKNDEDWGNFNYVTFLRLRSGANTKQVEQKLKKILDQNRDKNEVTTALLPLSELHFDESVQNSSFATGNRQAAYIFAILAALLLVVACINYINLTTARANMRSREVGIRKIVGAARSSLFGQFLSESLLTCLLALVFTIVFIQLSLPVFNRIAEKQFTLPIASAGFWVLITGTLVTVTVLTGIYPALLLSSFSPVSIFRGSSIMKLKDATLRKVLVVTQFTISVMLIAATLIIFNQLKFIQRENAAYNRSQIFSFNIPYKLMLPFRNDVEKVHSLQSSVKQQLQMVTGVDQVTYANEAIINLQSMTAGSADWDGRPKDFNPSVSRLSADEDFPAMFGLQLAEGRWFEPGNKADIKKSFILNETAVKQFNLHKPYIGQRFVFGGDTGSVTGVVKDFHFRSLREAVTPLVMHTGGNWRGTYFVKLDPRNASRVLAGVEKVWHNLVPNQPLEYTFLDESFDKLYRSENRISLLMTLFACIAVFISCLGLLGLAAFTTERRKKEISIRKVLGASINSIVSLLSREFLLLVLLAIIIATPVAWWAMNKWLEDFVYRIHINGWIFLLAGIIAIFITLVIVGIQGMKAALVNPAKNLRSE